MELGVYSYGYVSLSHSETHRYENWTTTMDIFFLFRRMFFLSGGWSGGAKVLGKLSVPGRPASLDDSRARAYCSCSRCRWGLFGHFFPDLSILFSSPSLWETAPYRLKYCLKGPLNPKQPTNQSF